MVVIPSKMGRLNKRALLDRLHNLGMASRASLAKSLGLSQPTAGKIVDELLELGVVEELDVDEPDEHDRGRKPVCTGRVGRPARMLRLNRARPRFLGIQLDVTETSLAPLPVGVHGGDEWSVRVPTLDSAQAWVGQLQKAAAQIKQRTFWGVLVSVPGIVEEHTGRVLFSPNLHWTERADLTELIRSVWNAPVILVQEERALALGHQAANPGSEGFLLVDLGEGVGGAVVIAGELYVTPLPLSGELGHTPVPGNERPCGCGGVGCLETLVSTRGLLQTFADNSPASPHTWPALVAHLAEHGAVPWLAETLENVGIVIAGALNVLGLRRVVITGRLNELSPAVLHHLAGAISRGAMWGRFGRIDVESAPRRRIAGLVCVGIDRLVMPVADVESQHETLLPVAVLHGAGSSSSTPTSQLKP